LWPALHDRDLRAEAPEHLGELQAHVATAEDQQVIWHLVQLHDGRRVQRADGVDPFDGYPAWPCPDVYKHALGTQLDRITVVEPNLEFPGACKAGFAADQIQVLGVIEALLASAAEAVRDIALAPSHLDHVHVHGAVLDAVVGGAAVKVGYLRAGDHRLGRGTALVDAGAADVLAFYDRRLASCAREGPGKWVATLARADNDGVVVL
jgi:hypothetical protein